MASPNTILLKVTRLSDRYRENRAAGAIMPGDLIANDATGKWVKQGTAAVAAAPLFAIEDSFQGKTIDDAYASGDLVRGFHAQRGDEIYAWVAANAAAILLTDTLTPDGTGGVRKGATTDIRIAEPVEALDNSAVGARARLRIRVL